VDDDDALPDPQPLPQSEAEATGVRHGSLQDFQNYHFGAPDAEPNHLQGIFF
jgi:hypothetical protein